MQQTQVKARPRLRHTTPADPPTINSKIARVWFPESQTPAPAKSGGQRAKACRTSLTCSS